jgi:hypothetical protein
VACFNRLLVEERKQKREELLQATEKELETMRQQGARRKKKILRKEEIALQVGRVVNRFKMAKHFGLSHRRRKISCAAPGGGDAGRRIT